MSIEGREKSTQGLDAAPAAPLQKRGKKARKNKRKNEGKRENKKKNKRERERKNKKENKRERERGWARSLILPSGSLIAPPPYLGR